ncbi:MULTISPECIES: acyl carrier protein [Nocardia]|uniref:Acyl carrier protein n=1 Tax=Nocardia implantans TaxID=3108168 RepID=A0ABU6AYM6_9NOCA|nr:MULTISPECIES: acyl carrier protein [unclassified Nocardia]MBF6194319.1 acyl carrier protein [Nocardia beijingensis]MEA3529928.1 acyl carrier protein [Nocardia sp. CDC192]MEB3512594.1 acyl carrier protein [Nocardia sp. CDC186]
MSDVVQDSLTSAVADLVATATDGTLDADSAQRSEQTFAEAGMTSLSFLRLVDALEIRYGVEIDLENDLDHLRTVAAIVAYLRNQGVEDA